MEQKIKRVYVDTSAVLGNFDIDETRRQETDVFWNAVRSGEIVAVVSDVLNEELKEPSEHVWDFFAALPDSQIKWIERTAESDTLAKQYIAANVVTGKKMNDCRHVALASLHADGIVSWNLRDMVKRAKRYKNVNVAKGYPEIKIVTPNEYRRIYQ